MRPLFSIVASLLRLSLRRTASRIATISGLLAVALVLVAIGLAGFTAALWLWLARHLDPVIAALVIGGAAFFLAAIMVLIARSKLHADSRIDPGTKAMLDALKLDHDQLLLWGPLVAALLAGFLAGSGKSKD